jgi:phosphatidate cytidylyltransferase
MKARHTHKDRPSLNLNFIKNEFILRGITSILLAPIFLGVYYAGNIILLIAVIILTLVVNWEFYGISTKAGYRPAKVIGAIAAVVIVFGSYFQFELTWFITFFLLVLTPIWISRATPPTKLSVANWAITVIGVLYSGGLLHHLILLRDLPQGLVYGLMVFLGTWTADTSAYLIGRYFGKHQFSPNISPNKTWEGAIAGFLLSLTIVFLVGSLSDVELGHRLMLGIIIPISVICGDLTESMLKRSAGQKDASNLIPGHGGLLDRIDGLIFAVVTVYYYVSQIIGS